jgi:uncharacterized protein
MRLDSFFQRHDMTVTEPTVTTLIYERMVEDALRGVLRKALEITQSQGLPGSHHFYITFDTKFPGVRIANSLHAMHPSEMTIVLQHQYWDLRVDEESFDITLSFSGVSQHLHIPFAAVTAFADPHAKFGLQFHVEFEDEDTSDMDEDEFDEDDDFDIPQMDNSVVTQKLKTSRLARNDAAKVENTDVATDGDEDAGKVITLDAFRKK